MSKPRNFTLLGRYTTEEWYGGVLRKVDREWGTGRLLKIHTKRRRKAVKIKEQSTSENV